MKINYNQEFEPIEFSAERRRKFFDELENTSFDLCIIGAGITGAGIARDAAMRGLKTILIEKDDFGAGTSSRSSKLVHGGLRYLKQYHFGLVREALRERHTLLHIAPHLVSRLPTIFPVYKGAEDGYWKIQLGMIFYDSLCGTKKIGRHHMRNAQGITELTPELRREELVGGAVYYDGKTDDSRLVMATVQSAVAAGCKVLNYCRAGNVAVKNSRIESLIAVDEESNKQYQIKAKVFVNAAGPWSDQVRRLADESCSPQLRPTLGVHLLVPWQRCSLHHALMLISRLDNRPFYAIPCQARDMLMVGTTDTDFNGDLDKLPATTADVDYILKSFNYYFPETNLEQKDVISVFSGLRPLIYEEGKKTGQVSREHKIFHGPENMVHIIGGKLTTYRCMAIDLLRYVKKHCQLSMPGPKTDRFPLYGGAIKDYSLFVEEKIKKITDRYQVSKKTVYNLIHTYGSNIDEITALWEKDPQLKEVIVPELPYVWGQLPYAVQREMTITLRDFLIRRTHIFSVDWRQGQDIAAVAADRMAQLLHWSEAKKQKELDEYLEEVSRNREFRKESIDSRCNES